MGNEEWEVGSGKWGMGNGLSVVTLSLPKGDEEQRTFFTPWFGKPACPVGRLSFEY